MFGACNMIAEFTIGSIFTALLYFRTTSIATPTITNYFSMLLVMDLCFLCFFIFDCYSTARSALELRVRARQNWQQVRYTDVLFFSKLIHLLSNKLKLLNWGSLNWRTLPLMLACVEHIHFVVCRKINSL